jgi:hypothetical protein
MRLLIAVGEAVSDPTEVPAGIPLLVDGAEDILVMSPSLVSRLDWLTGGVDQARHVADDRLAVVLDQLESVGASASGVRGDELPLTAFEDAVRDFGPDHILLAVRASASGGWQGHDLITQLLDRFRLPVTVFAIEAEGRG